MPHHCDTSGQPYQDQPFSKAGLVRQKRPSQTELKPCLCQLPCTHLMYRSKVGSTYHQEGRDQPVHHHAKHNLFPNLARSKGPMQRLILDLAQDRIHHDQQADRYCLVSRSVFFANHPQLNHLPIGTDTPTNFPFCNASPVLGTKFPRMIPIAIASKIHKARKRSSQPSPLNADVFPATGPGGSSCFSGSGAYSGCSETTERWFSMAVSLLERGEGCIQSSRCLKRT